MAAGPQSIVADGEPIHLDVVASALSAAGERASTMLRNPVHGCLPPTNYGSARDTSPKGRATRFRKGSLSGGAGSPASAVRST